MSNSIFLQEAESEPRPVPDATIMIKLRADSGYQSDETHRITVEQWTSICKILASCKILADD